MDRARLWTQQCWQSSPTQGPLRQGGGGASRTFLGLSTDGKQWWVKAPLAVLAEPVADEPVGAYREALSVCADLSVPVHPHGDERSVAAEAVRLLNA